MGSDPPGGLSDIRGRELAVHVVTSPEEVVIILRGAYGIHWSCRRIFVYEGEGKKGG